MTRDFDIKPYSADEERVAAYLRELLPEVGTGDDPIGFLIASHAAIVQDRRAAATPLAEGNRQLPDYPAPTATEKGLSLFERMSRIARASQTAREEIAREGRD